jgi:hypothetical protein
VRQPCKLTGETDLRLLLLLLLLWMEKLRVMIATRWRTSVVGVMTAWRAAGE